MQEVITEIEATTKKSSVPAVKSGDTVRVHQKIWEGKKERVQIFEGTVIRCRRLGSLTAAITVRRLAVGVGVEKTYFLHSPNVVKVDIVKRGRVRRNYLTYLRARQGKATRLQDLEFDRQAVNVQSDQEPSTAKPVTKPAAEKTVVKEEKKPKAKTEDQPVKVSEPTTAAEAKPVDKVQDKSPDSARDKKAKAEEFRKKHQG